MFRQVTLTAMALLAFPICFACGRSEDPSGAVATVVDTVGGVEWVRNAGQPATWSLEKLVRLGSVDEEAQGFGRVYSILADDTGRVYVGDEMLNEIKVFDSTGSLLRTVGRSGAGPGEFGRLYSLTWLGDTLVAMDPGNARLGLLSPQGDWYGHWQHQPITGPPQVIRFFRSSDVDFYVRRLLTVGDSVASVFVRFAQSGEIDTLPLLDPALPAPSASVGYTCESPNGIGFFATPYHPTLIQTFGPGGYRVAAQSGRYEVLFLDEHGDSARVVSHDRPPVPVSDAEWDGVLVEFRGFRERWSGARCEPRGDPPRPASKPAVRNILFDAAGRMWVEVVTKDGFAFDVFDAGGRLLATVPAPERDERVEPYVRGERLYIVARDSLGVQHVEGYRIRGS